MAENPESSKNPECLFQPGGIIVPLAEPFLKILNDSCKGKLCDKCFHAGTLRRCVNCKIMYYCGTECQKLDWKEGHSVECKSELFKNPELYKEGIPFDPNLTAKIFRTLAKFYLKPGSFSEKHTVYGDQKMSFHDMMFHEKNIYQNDWNAQCFTRFFKKLRSADSSFSLVHFDEDFLKRIFKVWRTKGVTIRNLDETQTIGTGICVPHSAFDHSCRPNSVCIGRVDKFEVRCIHPIMKGEKPTVSYLTGNMTPKERRPILRIRHNILNCSCETCIAEESEPLVDYAQIELIQDRLKRPLPSYLTIIGLRDRGLKLFRQLYHEYDDRITNFCCTAFYTLCEYQMASDEVPKPFLRKEAADLQNRLKITFGEGSFDLYLFQRKMKELEQMDRELEN